MASTRSIRVVFIPLAKSVVTAASTLHEFVINSYDVCWELFRKSFNYFIPSLVAIVRGIYFTHEDRVSVL